MRWYAMTMLFLAAGACLNLSCNSSNEVYSKLENIGTENYYNKEILSDQLFTFYGKWKLKEVTGGFTGLGHEPHFDYLLMKPFGIYGIIKNDILVEYGKVIIQPNTTPKNYFISFICDPVFTSNNGYYLDGHVARIPENDTINMRWPGSDGYDYHLVREQ